jgi:uracil phosphoribosyltransferase
MRTITEHGQYRGEVINPLAKLVTVDIARGGTYPSQVLFEYLADLIDPDGVRQDHVTMNRTTDGEGVVTGAAIYGSKIGGDVNGRIVLFPDPMGATGSSMSRIIRHYKTEVPGGDAARYIVMNLIITPEFVRRMTDDHPDVQVYAVRLDRGLSSDDVLRTLPGERWDQEQGLTDKQYIVPGAGGFGEVMNNSPA